MKMSDELVVGEDVVGWALVIVGRLSPLNVCIDNCRHENSLHNYYNIYIDYFSCCSWSSLQLYVTKQLISG